jgi:hypothetical protein
VCAGATRDLSECGGATICGGAAVSGKSTRAAEAINVASMPGGSTVSPVRDNRDAARPTVGRGRGSSSRAQKPILRFIYSGVLIGTELRMQRGAFLRKTDADGAVVLDAKDKAVGLTVNLGDRIVLNGRDESAIAVAEVVKIEPGWNERLHLKILSGSCPDGPVHVLNAKGLGK